MGNDNLDNQVLAAPSAMDVKRLANENIAEKS